MASTIISHGSARSLENHARKMKWITDRCRGTHDVTNSESPHILCLTIVWASRRQISVCCTHMCQLLQKSLAGWLQETYAVVMDFEVLLNLPWVLLMGCLQ